MKIFYISDVSVIRCSYGIPYVVNWMISVSKKEKETLLYCSFVMCWALINCLFQVKVMKESALPFSAPAHATVRAISKSQEQRAVAAPHPAPVTETVVSSTNAKEDGNQLEAEGVQFVHLTSIVCCVLSCLSNNMIAIVNS